MRNFNTNKIFNQVLLNLYNFYYYNKKLIYESFHAFESEKELMKPFLII